MFWGLILEDGKRYHQIADKSYHISMACGKSLKGDCDVILEHGKAEYVLCILSDSGPQQRLDINITEGEEITLFLQGGKGTIYLSGYYETDFPAASPDHAGSPLRSSRIKKDVAALPNGNASPAETETVNRKEGALKRKAAEDANRAIKAPKTEETPKEQPTSSSGEKMDTEAAAAGGGGGDVEDEEEDEDFVPGKMGESSEEDSAEDSEEQDDDADSDLEEPDEDELKGLHEDLNESVSKYKDNKPLSLAE